MSNRMRRVIIVAKDNADLLTSLGSIAAKTFRSEPDAAYESVIQDLNSQNIGYLDLQLSMSDLPHYMGLWYFREGMPREAPHE